MGDGGEVGDHFLAGLTQKNALQRGVAAHVPEAGGASQVVKQQVFHAAQLGEGGQILDFWILEEVNGFVAIGVFRDERIKFGLGQIADLDMVHIQMERHFLIDVGEVGLGAQRKGDAFFGGITAAGKAVDVEIAHVCFSFAVLIVKRNYIRPQLPTGIFAGIANFTCRVNFAR